MSGDAKPTALFDGSAEPALVQVGEGGSPAELLEAARAAGRQPVGLDLQRVADKAEFMTAVARALNFPDWFGRNWDALHDLLTDADWMPADTGRALLISGWQRYAAAAPGEWETALRILSGAVEFWRRTATPLFVVLLGGPVTDPAHPTPGTSG